MNIVIISDTITIDELKKIAKEFYVTMIKGVVDIKKEVIAFGGQYHIDANAVLTEKGSQQQDVWGFNVNFIKPKEEWIEYNSLINIRPLQENYDMEVLDEDIRRKMKKIINSKIT
ncbi:MAG: hypothetical protein HY507_00965 [Candidatus Zambryskibacteria bacterium]|nr:hypothetical protein [Candidatus Zambryskibacteria bacterium]